MLLVFETAWMAFLIFGNFYYTVKTGGGVLTIVGVVLAGVSGLIFWG